MVNSYHITEVVLEKYLVDLIRKNKKEGITTTGIFDNYKMDFGLARRGKGKADKKREILDRLEKLRGSEEVKFENGRYFPSD